MTTTPPANTNTIYVYNGGSFSPPTLAHQQICIDTIANLQERFLHDSVTKIEFLITPVPDVYPKASVRPECISYQSRCAMIKIMIGNIQQSINSVFKGKEYEIVVSLNQIEQTLSHETKSDGSGINGFMGTYNYVDAFSKRAGVSSSNIFLLLGLDNAKALVSTGAKRWKNPIHLVSRFKFLIYPRSGFSIDYAEMFKLFNANVESFDSATQLDINLSTNTHNLDDIATEITQFRTDPEQFLRDRFMVITASESTATEDSISIADTSSSKIRRVLYNYDKFGITLRQEVIQENLQVLDPRILQIIKENHLYTDGMLCEGEKEFQNIIKSIPEEWKN